MNERKTLRDLHDMKTTEVDLFGNQYNYFFATLEDYYIAKMEGRSRIKAELLQWDTEAKREIVEELADRLEATGLMNFNRDDILSLVYEE